jgi:hypothetical protein
LYEEFSSSWFERQFIKGRKDLEHIVAQTTSQQNWRRWMVSTDAAELEKAYVMFSREVAVMMFRAGVVNADVSVQSQSAELMQLLSDGDPVAKRLRMGSPLRRVGESQWSFIHKSFLEYFVACAMIEEVGKGKSECWSSRLLPRDERGVMLFLSDAVKMDWIKRGMTHGGFLMSEDAEKLKGSMCEGLMKMVLKSREDKSEGAGVAAANALTVMNYGHVCFSGVDLSGVRVAGADLQRSMCHKTNWRGAVFTSENVLGKPAGVMWNEGMMDEGVFDGCVMGKEGEFGEYPSLLGHEGAVIGVAHSRDGN